METYEEKMSYLLKEVKRITDEYCGGQCEYLSLCISPRSIWYNNAHWEGKEPPINVFIDLEEGEHE